MPNFIPGLKLNELFYHELVHPILRDAFPGLMHSAARLGGGSEVLGYDDAMSTDHDWGPRFQLFLREADFEAAATAVSQYLADHLPWTFRGYSVHFGPPNAEGTRLPDTPKSGAVAHRITVTTIRRFFLSYLAFDPTQEPTTYNWLTFPQQLLLGMTAGQVYHDGLGELEPARRKLVYYPHDIWLYLMAAQWNRIAQEEHLFGRSGWRGDELGAGVMAARLAHDVMQLCFLQERTYMPYPKWFGTAFSQLSCAHTLRPILQQVVSVSTWQERESALCAAYEQVALQHNTLGVTEPLETAVSSFYDRPFRVIYAGRFAQALKTAVSDPTVKAITTDIGSIDQFSHSTDLRAYPQLQRRLETLYQ